MLVFPAAGAETYQNSTASRRVSVCNYIVSFPETSDSLSDQAKRVIADATRQALAFHSRSIAVGTWSTRAEGRGLQNQRFKSIQDELALNHWPREQIDHVTISDQPPGRPEGNIHVCDSYSEQEAQQSLPEQPNRRIDIVVGQTTLAIPLRYLNPVLWRDIPFEPVVGDRNVIELGWPGLQDRMSDTMQRCTRERASGIQCDERLFVYLSAPGLWTEGPRQSPASDPAYTPVSTPLDGVTFFLRSNSTQKLSGEFEGVLDGGKPILGWCRWDTPLTNGVAIAPQILAALQTQNGTFCNITNFEVGNGLWATVVFSGKYFPEWRSIYDEVSRLLLDFMMPPHK